MRETEKGKKNKKVYIFIISAVAVLLIVAILAVALWDSKYGFFPEQEVEVNELKYNGVSYEPRYGIETFLIIGLDKMSQDIEKGDFRNDSQADFLMLLVFDSVAKTYSAIQINRDTVTQMDTIGIDGHTLVGTVTKQIALAHTYGSGEKESCKNVARAVSKLLYGVDVNYYMSFTIDSIGIINDLVGGVTLEVLDDFSEVDKDLGLIKGETVTLNAKQARAYVQSRKDVGDSTNDNRMKRQQQFLDALQKQAEEKFEKDPDFAVNALAQMSEFIVTDTSSARLDALSQKTKEYEFKGIKKIDGETEIVKNLVEFYPDEDSLAKIVIESFYKVKEEK